MKPKIETVLQALAIKKQITDLYEQQDQLIAELHREFGPGRFDYNLGEIIYRNKEIISESLLPDGSIIKVELATRDYGLMEELLSKGPYLKFEIIDNLDLLRSGQTVFKSTAISPLSFASGSLKRKPKSLIEEMEQEDE